VPDTRVGIFNHFIFFFQYNKKIFENSLPYLPVAGTTSEKSIIVRDLYFHIPFHISFPHPVVVVVVFYF
jgi:hypothetical protein